MKRRTLCLLAMCTLLTGCLSESHVPGYGEQPCIGLGQTPDPRFTYKLSAWNIFVGVLFLELIVPPIAVVANELLCPVAVKPEMPR